MATPAFWAGFILFVIAMMALDLFVLGGKTSHRVSAREAGAWTIAWIGLALTFNFLLWWWLDTTAGREVANTKALEFLTGYLIELSLSVDYIFVLIMIFSYFAVLVMKFHWILYVFGAFLVITGIKMPMTSWHHRGLRSQWQRISMLGLMRRLMMRRGLRASSATLPERVV